MTEPVIDVHLTPAEAERSLHRDARRGLTSSPRWLQPKWFYDARGSDLFEQITRLPEYYPTRAEAAILGARAADIATRTGAHTLVELGSGSSEKTRLLLDALQQAGTLRQYVPVDVSETALRDAVKAIHDDYPILEIHGIVADFTQHLDRVPGQTPRMIAFLGGTIGNFEPRARLAFLAALAATMAPGDTFLLGTDLVKDRDRLVRAYDDSAGVTAEFNRNVLRVLNYELDADFAPERFRHRAVWDGDNEWIEMHLVADDDHLVNVGALDLKVAFAADESIRTEISAKFRRAGVEAELSAAGLELVDWYTDPDGDFALSLSVCAELRA